jgi:hypothetical protein
MDACLCSSTHFCLTTQEGEDEENTLSCTKDRGEKKTHPPTPKPKTPKSLKASNNFQIQFSSWVFFLFQPLFRSKFSHENQSGTNRKTPQKQTKAKNAAPAASG